MFEYYFVGNKNPFFFLLFHLITFSKWNEIHIKDNSQKQKQKKKKIQIEEKETYEQRQTTNNRVKVISVQVSNENIFTIQKTVYISYFLLDHITEPFKVYIESSAIDAFLTKIYFGREKKKNLFQPNRNAFLKQLNRQ